jgi:hypothetical protein
VRPVWLQAVIVDLQTAAGHVTIGERDEFHEFLKELASRLPSSSGPIERITQRGFLVEFACACGKLSTIRRTGSRGSSPAPSRQNAFLHLTSKRGALVYSRDSLAGSVSLSKDSTPHIPYRARPMLRALSAERMNSRGDFLY